MPNSPGRAHRKGISIPRLLKMFPDDDAAEKWLVAERWPDGIACPRCGSMNVNTQNAHKTMPFRCRDCRRRFSVKTDTPMEASNIGYQNWVIGMYLIATSLKGVSSMHLHRDLEISQKAAWHMAHRIRAMLSSGGGGMFEGPVEADETFVGGKSKNMHAWQRKRLDGRGSDNKVAVAGIRDRKTKQVRARVVDRVDSDLAVFAMAHTDPGAPIYTDESPIYDCIPNHETVKHNIGEYVRGQVSTNGMESFWSMLKRGYIGTFHRMSPEHLHRYVAEFEGRHNNRDADTEEQMGRMVRGGEGKRLKYDDLTAHRHGDRAVAV